MNVAVMIMHNILAFSMQNFKFLKEPYEQEGQREFLQLVQVKTPLVIHFVRLCIELLITSIQRLMDNVLQKYGRLNTSNTVPNICMIQRIGVQRSRTRKAWYPNMQEAAGYDKIHNSRCPMQRTRIWLV